MFYDLPDIKRVGGVVGGIRETLFERYASNKKRILNIGELQV